MTIKATLLLLLFSISLTAQSDIGIGQWKSHLPYSSARFVTQSNDKIIYGTDLSIFTIDKDDGSLEFISKVDGLTDTGIAQLEYDFFNDQLIIAYENSIIDLVSADEVFPIFNLEENTSFIDRRVYDIFVQNEEWAYFATGFGVLQYNLIDRNFGFTLDARQRVSSVEGNGEQIIFSGEEGAFTLDVSQAVFPNAFSEWNKLETGLPQNYNSTDVLVIGNASYVLIENTVYKSEDFANYTEIYSYDESGFNATFLKKANNGWMMGLRNAGSAFRVLVFDETDALINEINSCANKILDAELLENGAIYFGDEFDSVRYIDENGECQKKILPGTFNKNASDISIKDNVVYVASGGVTENFGIQSTRHGIYVLEDKVWNNINQDNTPFYRDNDVTMFYQIEAHPSEPIVYIGSFDAGVIEYNYEDESLQLFNSESTDGVLGGQAGNSGAVKIAGMAFDNDDNLWMSSFSAVNPVVVKTPENIWYDFSVNSDTKAEELLVDDFGFVWVVIAGNTGGINVIDPGDNLADPTDDGPTRFFNFNNSAIPTNVVNCVAKDLDGAIWVGTGEGAVTFECGSTANESDCIGNRRTVLQDSIRDFLLRSEDVLTIEVDGANRKWFGTRNGVFVQDPSGEIQIAKYDVENSPLFDNLIKELSYNSETGEMFIVSNKGIQSIRTETTGARRVHSSNVYAFPNPVRPEYRGPIAIKGLAQDAEVRITDIDGQLVYETDALGGQAIWSGKNLNGGEVAGGVYLVFSSSTDNFTDPDTYVTKILVVR